MQAAVRGKQPESTPALIHVCRGGLLEAADIVAPEAEARQAQRKPASQALCHRFKRGGRVASPMHGELLPAGRRLAGKDSRLAFTELSFQGLKDGFVIKVCVVVVHQNGVGAIEVSHIDGDALTKIGLEGIHAHS